MDRQAEAGSVFSGPPSVCSPSVNAVQAASQQTCLNEQNNNASLLAKARGTQIGRCIREYAKGSNKARLANLGGSFSALACFQADFGGKLAKSEQKLRDRETLRCTGVDRNGLSKAADFGLRNAAAVIPVAKSRPLDLFQDLLGSNADTALVFTDVAVAPYDRQGSSCQIEVASRAQALYDQLWTVARKAKKDALVGRDL